MGLSPKRVKFQPMVLPIFKILPKFIDDFNKIVEGLGKIPDDKRQTLLEI